MSRATVNWTRFVAIVSTTVGFVVSLETKLTFRLVVILLLCLAVNLVFAMSAIVLKKKTDAGLAFASIFLIISVSDWTRYGPTYLSLLPAITSILCVAVVLIESRAKTRQAAGGSVKNSEEGE